MTKEEKDKIEYEEIKKVFEYFKRNKLDNSNELAMHIIKHAINKIFQLEVQELGYKFSPDADNKDNTFLLEIINNINSRSRGLHLYNKKIQDGKIVKSKPKISYNLAVMTIGLDDENAEIRLDAVKTIFRIVFHEIQHHRQALLVETNVSSNKNLMFARDFAIKKFLHPDFYSRDGKTGNYEEFILENDANRVGYQMVSELLANMGEGAGELVAIEDGKYHLSRYKLDTTSKDGTIGYRAKGAYERSDITIPILDYLICERGNTDILRLFPILRKEYNMNGTKKSAIELVKQLMKEREEINSNTEITTEEKQELIRECEGMYFELIYNALQNDTYHNINQIKQRIGMNASAELFQSIKKYFEVTKNGKIETSRRMAEAYERSNEFVMPENDGTIMVAENEMKKSVSVDEFIDLIDKKLLTKRMKAPRTRRYFSSRIYKKILF